jgi:hypothetical protein
VTTDRLSNRALNRATLDRQLLLARVARSVDDTIEHLVGMQAQNPLDPYYGLWARLEQFEPTELSALIEDREAVRTAFLRATIHLVTSADCLGLDATIRPVSARTFGSTSFSKNTAGMDIDQVLALGRRLLEEAPMGRAELGRVLAERWPERDPQSMAYTVSYLLPLVQVPPRGLWGKKGPATWTTVDHWLGSKPSQEPAHESLVLRYLAAYGPATVSDIRVWSGVTGLAAVVGKLRPGLRVFIDEYGRELLDLPDAPRPDPDTSAPPRFLPEYDNVLLGHADRSRLIELGAAAPGWAGNLLYDGFLRGSWKISRSRGKTRIVVTPFTRLSKKAVDEVTQEGLDLLQRVAPVAGHEVEFTAAS